VKPAEGGVERLMNVYVSMGVTPPVAMRHFRRPLPPNKQKPRASEIRQKDCLPIRHFASGILSLSDGSPQGSALFFALTICGYQKGSLTEEMRS
jgi:hypothetical protein